MKNLLFILLDFTKNRIPNEDLEKWGMVVSLLTVIVVSFLVVVVKGRQLYFLIFKKSKEEIKENEK